MAKAEIQREENPYKLSKEELICPDTHKMEWFGRLVVQQREGIEHGVRPRNPRLLSHSLRKQWLGKVWNYFLNRSSFSQEERRIIKRTTGSGREYHTRPTHRKLGKDG